MEGYRQGEGEGEGKGEDVFGEELEKVGQRAMRKNSIWEKFWFFRIVSL